MGFQKSVLKGVTNFIKSGLPHRSPLSPLLFNMYTLNNIKSQLGGARQTLYVDDILVRTSREETGKPSQTSYKTSLTDSTSGARLL